MKNWSNFNSFPGSSANNLVVIIYLYLEKNHQFEKNHMDLPVALWYRILASNKINSCSAQRQFPIYSSCKHKNKSQSEVKNNFVVREGAFFWLLTGKLCSHAHAQSHLVQEITRVKALISLDYHIMQFVFQCKFLFTINK